MKRFLFSIGCMALVVIAISAIHSVAASADEPMTDAHIQRIKSNCSEAQDALYQLHASDALLRVNRGQLYESMSTKLMEPFDSWLATNSYNAADLVSTAATYNHELDNFRSDYQQYEESLSSALQVDCVNEPVMFYDDVADARTKRVKVHDDALSLHKTIADYQTAVEAFSKNFTEGKQ